MPFGDLGNGRQLNKCYAYDPVTDNWDELEDLRRDRAYGSGVLVPNFGFWATGGFTRPSSPFPEIVEYSTEYLSSLDNDRWEYGPSLPVPMYGHCAIQLDSNITLFAG